jgi:thiopurine S-methyltransferase
MDAGFWHSRWENAQIGFHEGTVNRMLAAHVGRLPVPADARVFLPLCGKTRDIAWLLSRGFRVAGAELSEIAVRDLFDEMGVTPEVTNMGKMKRYAAGDVDIFVGDIFDLGPDELGPVDAVFDRAALVALPEDMRARYTRHLAEITRQAPQILVTFDYDQGLMDGPPFAVPDGEVERLYAARFDAVIIDDQDVAGGLKGRCPAREKAWLIRDRQAVSR